MESKVVQKDLRDSNDSTMDLTEFKNNMTIDIRTTQIPCSNYEH